MTTCLVSWAAGCSPSSPSQSGVVGADGRGGRGRRGRPRELASLTDRVAANVGRPQTYGTQGGWTEDGTARIAVLAEPERVDQLRVEAGLSTLEKVCAES
jgi:hypothetical protein